MHGFVAHVASGTCVSAFAATRPARLARSRQDGAARVLAPAHRPTLVSRAAVMVQISLNFGEMMRLSRPGATLDPASAVS
ncbi:Hypothetical protein A7982_08861 [Minicystis rosea]|nr:Hypothetical protein A7982_08861 [Minicystis rosea]